MAFFKRKPDPKVMGFLVSQTSMNRILEVMPAEDEIKKLYVLSTSIIACVLEQQYAAHIIDKTLEKSDEFFVKEYKQFKTENTLVQLRTEWREMLDLNHEESFKKIAVQFHNPDEIEKCIIEWSKIPLLISSDIKSE